MLAKVQGEGVGFVVRNLECGVMVRAEEREGVRLETLDIVRARASPCTERESGARAGLHATVGSRQGGARPAGREPRILWIFGFYFRVLFSGRSNPKKEMRVPGEGGVKYFAFFGLFFRVIFSGRNPKIEPENITRKTQKIFTNHCPGNRNKNEIAGDRGQGEKK